MLGRSPFLARNFPVIDRFERGIATSIKSIDLRAAKYQNIRTLMRVVQQHIDTLANWQGQLRPWGGVRIRSYQITGRVLELAVPPEATPAQEAALRQLQQYAESLGVMLKIIVIK
ncbi:MAG TPA: hypothetical protein EYH31_14020 [Anaerolineae bacterium]|nr:hypothetical protein [Anaerolineae bacterium]